MMGVGELRGEGPNDVVVKFVNFVVRLLGTVQSGIRVARLGEESNPGAAAETEEMMLGEAAMLSFGAKASISTRVFRWYYP